MKNSKSKKLGRRENIAGLLFVALPLLYLVLFTLVPVVFSLYISFTAWTGFTTIGNAPWVGINNYRDILGGVYWEEFRMAVFNTVFMMLGIPICLILALLLALALNKKLPGRGVFRVIYYVPAITSIVAVSIIFTQLFRIDGAVNDFLSLFGISGIRWLDRAYPARWLIIIISVWGGLGFMTLLYLAGLQGISQEYYEAARLDGANAFQMLWKLTVPLIRPVTFFLVITNVIGGFQKFSEPFILFPFSFGYGPEMGGLTIMVFLFFHFSGQSSQYGVASATAWILAFIILLVTLLQFWINKRRRSDI